MGKAQSGRAIKRNTNPVVKLIRETWYWFNICLFSHATEYLEKKQGSYNLMYLKIALQISDQYFDAITDHEYMMLLWQMEVT